MRPRFELLDSGGIELMLDQAMALLRQPGIRIKGWRVHELLSGGGAHVEEGLARIPEALALDALKTAPREFFLHARGGQAAVHYGGNEVHFAPGSSCAKILDYAADGPREAQSQDLVRLVCLAEALPQYAAQSTALVCNDVPAAVADMHRLLLVLRHSSKPIVTGAFTAETLRPMLEMLIADAGTAESLRQSPRAVFDVCPSSPLNWTEFGAENLIDLARAGVPAEVVPAPMSGATSPVTLMGTVVQHAAECLSGIVIHQLAQPGAPIVWGGAAAVFDMRTGASCWGAIETAMLAAACAQIGKHLGLPTHAYLATSDSKSLDAQAGLESGISAALGALAGINMISGAGMLEFLSCHSLEKLALDAEIIALIERLLKGIAVRPDLTAQSMVLEAAQRGGFLKLEATRQYFREEQCLLSEVIDRDPARAPGATQSTLARAQSRVTELLAAYQRPSVASEVEGVWEEIVKTFLSSRAALSSRAFSSARE